MTANEGKITLSELVYSLRESADALTFYGVYSSVFAVGDGEFPAERIEFIYEFFEDCIESALPELSACLVRLYEKNGILRCRIVLDNVRDSISESWRSKECEKLGASVRLQKQDETLYATLSFGKKEAIL